MAAKTKAPMPIMVAEISFPAGRLPRALRQRPELPYRPVAELRMRFINPGWYISSQRGEPRAFAAEVSLAFDHGIAGAEACGRLDACHGAHGGDSAWSGAAPIKISSLLG
jgi:hypothetical protein